MTTLRDLPPEPRGGWMRRKYEARIKEMQGLDAAIIANELGIQERTVVMLQRKMGLRKCRQPNETT